MINQELRLSSLIVTVASTVSIRTRGSICGGVLSPLVSVGAARWMHAYDGRLAMEFVLFDPCGVVVYSIIIIMSIASGIM